MNNNYPLNAADQHLITNINQIDNVAAILFYGRSGTVFLQSLLDNHPEIIMMPGTCLMYFYEFWEQYAHLSSDELIKQFCQYFLPFFDVAADARLGEWKQPAIYLGFAQMGEHQDKKIEADQDKFVAVLKLILNTGPTSRKFFFQAIHIAYTITINRSQSLAKTKLPLIVYQLHTNHPERTKKLCQDFPKTKFIHILREPLQTLGSHFQHTFNCSILEDSYYHGFAPTDATDAKAIKLEDLHTEPKLTMSSLCQWLSLTWSPSLLESTFDGEKWWNLKTTEQVSGFNKLIISKNHNNLYYKLDIYRLKMLYQKRWLLWKYSNKPISKFKSFIIFPLLFLPFKMETIFWRAEIQSKGLKIIKPALINWYRRRRTLVKAWLYSLSSQTKEVELL